MLKSTTPASSIDRETAYRQQEAPIQKPPRQAAFHEAIDMGMNPADALKKCVPSTTKAITKERLLTCLDAGLDVHQMGIGFGTSSANIYFQCAKYQIKLSQRKPKKKTVKPIEAVDEPAAPEPAPAPIVQLEADPPLLELEPLPAPRVWGEVPEPVTVSAPPAEPEFIWFDRREKPDTGVLVRADGCIEISAAVSAGLTSDFVRIGITRDGTALKIRLADDGLLWTGSAGKRRRLNLKALVHELQWAKIPLPARYIGTWQGAEWTGSLVRAAD